RGRWVDQPLLTRWVDQPLLTWSAAGAALDCPAALQTTQRLAVVLPPWARASSEAMNCLFRSAKRLRPGLFGSTLVLRKLTSFIRPGRRRGPPPGPRPAPPGPPGPPPGPPGPPPGPPPGRPKPPPPPPKPRCGCFTLPMAVSCFGVMTFLTDRMIDLASSSD